MLIKLVFLHISLPMDGLHINLHKCVLYVLHQLVIQYTSKSPLMLGLFEMPLLYFLHLL